MKSDQLGVDLGVTTNTATSTTRRHFPTLSGWDAADWIPERPAWQAHGACVGSTVNFFPDRGEDHRPARALCLDCPVRAECLEYALVNAEKHGVWGGLSEKERRRIRRQRALERKAVA